MSDDKNTPQNPNSEKNSIPVSPQEPTADAPIPPMDSESAEAPSEAPEASREGFSDESNNIPPSNSTLTKPPSESNPEVAIPLEPTDMQANPASNGTSEPSVEPISEPTQDPESRTAQIPVNEPLTPKPETEIEPNIQEVKSEPVSVSNSGVVNEAKPESEPEKIIPVPVIVSNKNKIFELLVKAKNAIQFRKRKKLDRVMSLFLKQSKITNDDVEKFLHVSDATATRYLSQLEKENKIKQVGKTGKGVSYSKI